MAQVDPAAEPQRPLPPVDTRIERLPKLGAFEVRPPSPVAHLVRTAPTTAEFALIVRSDLKRHGLGRVLLAHLVAHACNLGLRALTAQVLGENLPMLRLAREAGFRSVGRSGFLIDMAKDMRSSDDTLAAADSA